MKRIRPWMLVYLPFFLLLTYVGVKNDVENHYPIIYIFLASFAYMAFNSGIILFAINFQNDPIKSVWRYLFPFLVVYFLASIVVDSIFGMNANHSPSGILLDLFVFVIAAVIFFPAFRASFHLAYRNLGVVPERQLPPNKRLHLTEESVVGE